MKQLCPTDVFRNDSFALRVIEGAFVELNISYRGVGAVEVWVWTFGLGSRGILGK